jgi:hypothetical protein
MVPACTWRQLLQPTWIRVFATKFLDDLMPLCYNNDYLCHSAHGRVHAAQFKAQTSSAQSLELPVMQP